MSSHLVVPSVIRPLRLLDHAMTPLMYALGGFLNDSLQETHPWHTYRGFDIDAIDISQAVPYDGSSDEGLTAHYVFLFHAPIFGGWTHYLYLTPQVSDRPFYIGWVVYDSRTSALLDKGISKLPISDSGIRMLVGPPHHHGYFFALNNVGQQIALERSGQGVLGDHRYPHIRLF